MNNHPAQAHAGQPDTDRNYALHVAIDWADKKHDVCIFDPETRKTEHQLIAHTPEDLTDFVSALRARLKTPEQKIALAVELKRGPLINFLTAFEFIDIYPVKTTTINHFRKAFYPSGSKSDPLDTALILEVLLKHPERLEQPWKPESAPMRLLAELTRSRRDFVDTATRLSQALRATLKEYFPQASSCWEII